MDKHKNKTLQVSVVLATHKASESLNRSVTSVVGQRDVEFELLVVGDGNPNGLQASLESFSDSRIRYIPVPRMGLTQALKIGCNEARYPFIARLDSADVMHPDRLRRQATVLHEQAHIGLVSSCFAFYTEEGFFLYQTTGSTQQFAQAIRWGDAQNFHCPMHASVMFTREAYERAGGYRDEFYYAQDCDLWTRILAHFDLHHLDEILTKGVFSADGISGQVPDRQAYYLQQAIVLRDLRKSNASETSALASLKQSAVSDHKDALNLVNRAPHNLTNLKTRRANANFFLARCLMQHSSMHANSYFERALKDKPFMLKAWCCYFLNKIIPRHSRVMSDQSFNHEDWANLE